jgi:hypothetical protein
MHRNRVTMTMLIVMSFIMYLLILFHYTNKITYHQKRQGMGQCRSVTKYEYETASDDVQDCRLCDVLVFSGHNSYLNGVQNFAPASIRAVQQSIDQGVRCIELDLYAHDKDTSTPIVAHGIEYVRWLKSDMFTTTRISFETVIEYLSLHAFEKTSDPLFVVIENNARRFPMTNSLAAEIIASISDPI